MRRQSGTPPRQPFRIQCGGSDQEAPRSSSSTSDFAALRTAVVAEAARPSYQSGHLPSSLLKHCYREIGAGGFTRLDNQLLFFQRVRSLVLPTSIVLDFGAGRGVWAESLPPGSYKARSMRLTNDVKLVLGCDIDPVVLNNPWLDAAILMEGNSGIPLPDASVDVIVSTSVFEHLATPESIAAELDRVLRPGGWICALTPSRYGYLSVGASLLPDTWHERILNVLQPFRQTADVFPTFYRLNSRRQLRRVFPAQRWTDYSYHWSGPPGYHAGRPAIAWFLHGLDRLLPAPLQRYMHIFLHKEPAR